MVSRHAERGHVMTKVALVTGATRGIGLSIATRLAADGMGVVVAATRQGACQDVANQLTAQWGVPAVGIAFDAGDAASVAHLAKEAVAQMGRVDVLVNNAGIARDNLLLRMTDEEWDAVVSVNLTSSFWLTRALIRVMMKQKGGVIVNVSSVIGVSGNAGQANYAASKAGLIGLTKSIAKEYGAKGIRCNAVAPGFISTDMTHALPNEQLDTIINGVSLKRLGTVEDVSGVVSFLASDSSSYMTGQVLCVDGGMPM